MDLRGSAHYVGGSMELILAFLSLLSAATGLGRAAPEPLAGAVAVRAVALAEAAEEIVASQPVAVVDARFASNDGSEGSTFALSTRAAAETDSLNE